MPAIDPVKIRGLRELQKALRDLDGESQKRLRAVLNDVAETIAAGARRRVPTRTGAAKASVKVASGQREAKVKEGSAKAPYAPFLDYGGRVGRNRSVNRPFVPGGRYLYPTYHANKAGIAPALEKALNALVEDAGLDVQ